MVEDALEEPDQYSDESRQRLRTASDAFIAAIEQHTVALTGLKGGSSSLPTLFELNDTVRRAAAVWDDAVGDHTGTFPIAVELPDENDQDEEDDEGGPDLEAVESVSVVSRWDLAVVDVDSLIRAGRSAWRRLWPEESEEDAAVSISDQDIGQALYALVHEFGEPWFEIPGVKMTTGQRVYLSTEASTQALDTIADEDIDEMHMPVVPQGEVLYGEAW